MFQDSASICYCTVIQLYILHISGFFRMVPTKMQKYFYGVFDYVGKADLSNSYMYQNPKTKLGVAMQAFFRDN